MTNKNLNVLTEVPGRISAEAILSYLQAYGVDGIISMEAIGSVYSLSVGKLGNVQILVKNEDIEQAKQLLEAYYQEAPADQNLIDDLDDLKNGASQGNAEDPEAS